MKNRSLSICPWSSECQPRPLQALQLQKLLCSSLWTEKGDFKGFKSNCSSRWIVYLETQLAYPLLTVLFLLTSKQNEMAHARWILLYELHLSKIIPSEHNTLGTFSSLKRRRDYKWISLQRAWQYFFPGKLDQNFLQAVEHNDESGKRVFFWQKVRNFPEVKQIYFPGFVQSNLPWIWNTKIELWNCSLKWFLTFKGIGPIATGYLLPTSFNCTLW